MDNDKSDFELSLDIEEENPKLMTDAQKEFLDWIALKICNEWGYMDDPLDGDQTEDITKYLLSELDDLNGNK